MMIISKKNLSIATILFSLALPTFASSIERVSVSSDGVEANSGSSNQSVGYNVSADGRFVIVGSRADNLVKNDNNNRSDVFLHDRQTGSTKLVSVNSKGIQGNNISYGASMSADGRYIVYESNSTNLDDIKTSNKAGIYLHDTQTGSTKLVSVNTKGESANGFSHMPTITSDGRYVGFSSSASNLAEHTRGTDNVYIHDTQTGKTTLVSRSDAGISGNSWFSTLSLSDNARFIAFGSASTNLVDANVSGCGDIYLRATETSKTTLISKDSNGVPGNDMSNFPIVSADGRFVAFTSHADNLVENDTNNACDVFIHDTQTNHTKLVSVNSDGVQGNDDNCFANIQMSKDARFITFASSSTNLVKNDTQGELNVFVHDMQTRKTEIVSLNDAGEPTNAFSYASNMSPNGKFISFTSKASNLVANDTNNNWDVFIRENPLAQE